VTLPKGVEKSYVRATREIFPSKGLFVAVHNTLPVGIEERVWLNEQILALKLTGPCWEEPLWIVMAHGANNGKGRKEQWELVQKEIYAKAGRENVILIGDLNEIMNEVLDQEDANKKETKHELLRSDLYDAYRLLHKGERVFSHTQKKTKVGKEVKTRIDLTLVSKGVMHNTKEVLYVDEWEGSDHKLVCWIGNTNLSLPAIREQKERLKQRKKISRDPAKWLMQVLQEMWGKGDSLGDLVETIDELDEGEGVRKKASPEAGLPLDNLTKLPEEDIDLLREACREAKAPFPNIQPFYLIKGGEVITDKEQYMQITEEWYEELFKAPQCPCGCEGETWKEKGHGESIQEFWGKRDKEWIKVHPKAGKLPNALIGREITREEYNWAIGKLGKAKATGLDGIPAEFYKAFSEGLKVRHRGALNAIMRGESLPAHWGKVEQVQIWKADDPNDYANYRPIGLVAVDYKIYVMIINRRLVLFVKEHGLLAETQAGFRAANSTLQQVRILIEYLRRARRLKQSAFLVYVDFRKAFDSVPFWAIELALEFHGIDKDSVNTIMRIYRQNITVQIRTKFGPTDPVKVGKGVRQGCPLSPLIFILVINSYAPPELE
jgi:hypothetical protein